MKLRGLTIAAVILAVLSGLLYWSNHRKPAEDTTVKASVDAAPKILSLTQADITRVAIRRKDQPELDLSKNGTGAWQITAPNSLAADQDAVSGVLSTLSSLTSDRLIEDKVTDLGPFGLSAPSLEIDISLKDNKSQKLLIGDQTPTGNACYVMLAGDPRLFTLASYNKSSFDKTASDLRDKRMFTADFDKVSQIELITQKADKKQDITFARNKDAWQILKPKPIRTDSSQVEELIRSLKDAKMDSAALSDDAKIAAAFKSAVPFATARIVGAAGTQEMEVRKAKDDYYAKSSVLSGIFKVLASVGTGLDKSLDDFRNKKLFDFGFDTPNKIGIHDGAKSYFLAHSGTDWWGSDGKKLDDMTVEPLLSNLRELSAAKYPDSGFTTASLEITVVSNEGKRVEKLLLAKNGDRYIAKRENEPALYEVAATAVADLQKSAADVKPAPAPAPAPPPKK